MPPVEHEREAPAVAEQAPTAVPAARTARPSAPAAVLRLQATAGNAVVANMLLREDSGGGPAAPAPATTSPSDRSSAGGPANTGKAPDFAKLIADKDTAGIRGVDDFTAAQPDQRVSMIHVMLEDTWWVGWTDRRAIARIWNAWGKDIQSAYDANQDLWQKCEDQKVDLAGMDSVKQYRDTFKDDVKAVAEEYTRKNKIAVGAERARLKVGGTDDVLGAGGPQAPPSQEVKDLQLVAAQVQRADDALKGLLEIPVGTTKVDAPSSEHGSAGGADDPSSRAKTVVDLPFKPDLPPGADAGGPPPGREKEFRSYPDVMAQHNRLTAARAIIASQSPALFQLTQDKPGGAGELAKMDPHDAATKLGRVLNQTDEAIDKSQTLMKDDELDWREFNPIHQQLWHGTPAKSGTTYSSKLAQSVSKGTIGDYKDTEFWTKIGVATLAGAAFLFSEIATGGMATFLWAAAGTAAGTGQAMASYKTYEDLKTAALSATSKDTRLVATEQVDEAQAAAILDAVMAFVDVAMAAKGAIGGARAVAATARVGAREGLANLSRLGAAEAADAIKTAVRELGAGETIRSAGMPVDQLVKLAGGETSAEGKALLEGAKDVAAVSPLGRGVAGLPAGIASPIARRLAAQAEPIFGRWASLSARERLEEMMVVLNQEMERIGAPDLNLSSKAPGLAGEFDNPTWGVAIANDVLAPATVTREQFASIWGLVSHEADHAKQWFEIAQMEAANGKSAAEVAGKLAIPESVAQHAADVQMGARPGVRLVQGTTEWAEVELFSESLIGKGAASRNVALKTVTKTAADLKAARAEWDAIFEHGPFPAGTDLDGPLKKWSAAFEANLNAEEVYVALPEEAAAYKTGGAAEQAMKERFALSDELSAARAQEAAGSKKMSEIVAEMNNATREGRQIPYGLTLDLDTQMKHMEELTEMLVEAAGNLEKAAGGEAP